MKKIFIKSGLSLLAVLSLSGNSTAKGYINQNINLKTEGSDVFKKQAAFKDSSDKIDETKEIEKLLEDWKSDVAKKEESLKIGDEKSESLYDEWFKLIRSGNLKEHKKVYDAYRLDKLANSFDENPKIAEVEAFDRVFEQDLNDSKKIYQLLNDEKKNYKEQLASIYISDFAKKKATLLKQLKKTYASKINAFDFGDSELFTIWNRNNGDIDAFLKIINKDFDESTSYKINKDFKTFLNKNKGNATFVNDKEKAEWILKFRTNPLYIERFKSIFEDTTFKTTTKGSKTSLKAALQESLWFKNYSVNKWIKSGEGRLIYETKLFALLESEEEFKKHFLKVPLDIELYKSWTNNKEGHKIFMNFFESTNEGKDAKEKVKKIMGSKFGVNFWKNILNKYNLEIKRFYVNSDFKTSAREVLQTAIEKIKSKYWNINQTEGKSLYNFFRWRTAFQLIYSKTKAIEDEIPSKKELSSSNKYKTLKDFEQKLLSLNSVNPLKYKKSYLFEKQNYWQKELKEVKKYGYRADTFALLFLNVFNQNIENLPRFIFGDKKAYNYDHIKKLEKSVGSTSVPHSSFRWANTQKDYEDWHSSLWEYDTSAEKKDFIEDEYMQWFHANFDQVYHDLTLKNGLAIKMTNESEKWQLHNATREVLGWQYSFYQNSQPSDNLEYNAYKKIILGTHLYSHQTHVSSQKKEQVKRTLFALWIYRNPWVLKKYIYAFAKAPAPSNPKDYYLNTKYFENAKWKTTEYYKDFDKKYSMRKYLTYHKNKEDELKVDDLMFENLQSSVDGIFPWRKNLDYSKADYQKWVEKPENKKLLFEIFKKSSFVSEEISEKRSDEIRKEFKEKLLSKKESPEIKGLIKKWIEREHGDNLAEKTNLKAFDDEKVDIKKYAHFFKNNSKYRHIFYDELNKWFNSYENIMWYATHKASGDKDGMTGWIETESFRRALSYMTLYNESVGFTSYVFSPVIADYTLKKEPNDSYKKRLMIRANFIQEKALKEIFNEGKYPLETWKQIYADAKKTGREYLAKYKSQIGDDAVNYWYNGIRYVRKDEEYDHDWGAFKRQLVVRFKYQFWKEHKKNWKGEEFEKFIDYFINKKFDKGEIEKAKFDYPIWTTGKNQYFIYNPPRNIMKKENWKINWKAEATSSNKFLEQLTARLKKENLLDDMYYLQAINEVKKTNYSSWNDELYELFFEDWMEKEFKGYMVSKSEEEEVIWDETKIDLEKKYADQEEWEKRIDEMDENSYYVNHGYKQWLKEEKEHPQKSYNYYLWDQLGQTFSEKSAFEKLIAKLKQDAASNQSVKNYLSTVKEGRETIINTLFKDEAKNVDAKIFQKVKTKYLADIKKTKVDEAEFKKWFLDDSYNEELFTHFNIGFTSRDTNEKFTWKHSSEYQNYEHEWNNMVAGGLSVEQIRRKWFKKWKENHQDYIKKALNATNLWYKPHDKWYRLESDAFWAVKTSSFVKTLKGKNAYEQETLFYLIPVVEKLLTQKDAYGKVTKNVRISKWHADYESWLIKAQNKKYALEFFKNAEKYTNRAITSFNKRVDNSGGKLEPKMTKEEWGQKIDEFAKKAKITTLPRVGNYTREQWVEIYIRDYFASYMWNARNNPAYDKGLYNHFIWTQIFNAMKEQTLKEEELKKTIKDKIANFKWFYTVLNNYSEEELKNSSYYYDLMMFLRKEIIAAYAPGLKDEFLLKIAKNNDFDPLYLKPDATTDDKSKFPDFFKDPNKESAFPYLDPSTISDLKSNDVELINSLRSRIKKLFGIKESEFTNKIKLSLYDTHQWAIDRFGALTEAEKRKVVIKAGFLKTYWDYNKLSNPTNWKKLVSIHPDVRSYYREAKYAKFLKTRIGKSLYEEYLAKIVALEVENKRAQSDQNGVFSKAPDIKTNFDDYKKWLADSENKKYALELFKHTKYYSDKAIASFNARVKKAKGKLGVNLTKEKWFQEIDKFAEKDKITKLSRVGNYTREQWMEIYIRDYFATYIRRAKQNSIISKDLYNFFVWKQIYNIATTKQENEIKKTNTHFDTLGVLKTLQEISKKTNDFPTQDDQEFATILWKWYTNNSTSIMKEFFKKELQDSDGENGDDGDVQVLGYVNPGLIRSWENSSQYREYLKNKTAANKVKYFKLFAIEHNQTLIWITKLFKKGYMVINNKVLTHEQAFTLIKPYYDNWYRHNFKDIMKKFFKKELQDSDGEEGDDGDVQVLGYVNPELGRLWENSSQYKEYLKNKTPYNKNKYFDLFVKNSSTTQKHLLEWFKTKNIFKKGQESGYDQAISLHKAISNIDPKTHTGRYVLDTFKLNQLVPHLQKMFPLANLNFDGNKFDKWLDSSKSEQFAKELFKESAIAKQWKEKANQREINVWLEDKFKNHYKLWKLPEFKEKIESWINKTLVGNKNVKPIDDLLSHIDLYYWAAKDSEEYKFLFDDFKNTSAKDKAFEKWVSNYNVVYKITNGIFKKTANSGIFSEHFASWKDSKEYKDYLKFIKKGKPETGAAYSTGQKHHYLVQYFKDYLGVGDETNSKLYTKLYKLYQEKELYWKNDSDVVRKLPLVWSVAHKDTVQGKEEEFSQYDLDLMQWLITRIKSNDEMHQELTKLWYWVKFNNYYKIKSNYQSEETFFQNAFEKWAKTDEAKTFFKEYLNNH